MSAVPERERAFDVLIVGGGPVGACAGALLARAAARGGVALRTAILEQNRPELPSSDAAPDLRVSAISRASENILAAAGAWDAIRARRLSAYERMRVWHGGADPFGRGALRFDAAEVGEPNLGYIIENRLVQAALLDAYEAAGGKLVPGRLTALRYGEECAAAETSVGTFTARLIVGADGAASGVREATGLTVEASSYRQSAIVARITSQRPHEATAWQRFLGRGTLAFLPLADGSCSIVWSLDEALAASRLAAGREEFESDLQHESAGVLGALRLASERQSFALRRLAAHHYVAQRCALIGDAAHVVHPLAGQGVNLGLLDAAALAQLLMEAGAEGEDPGALRTLRRYERWRKSENQLMSTAIDAFNRFLAHGSNPLARLAQHGLGWVNRSQEMRRFFIRRALGTAGELPRAGLVRS